MPGRRSILIDTDPGQDDAVALLWALAARDRLEVAAITTVAGNVGVDLTTTNALRVRDLAQCPEVPIHAGAAGPMVYGLETAAYISGPDGLAGAGLPPPATGATGTHGVEAIVRLLRERPAGSVTVCLLGPMTNLALALRLAPDIGPRIAECVVMAGALGLGNVTPAAEFNVYVDPHAAAVVLGAGIRTTLFGLHLTHQALAEAAHLERLRGLRTAAAACVHGMLTRPRASGFGTSHPMHDPCVIAWLLHPELFSGRDCHVEVETGPGPPRGRTTIDWNGRLRQPPNAFVPDRVAAGPLFDRMIDALATLP